MADPLRVVTRATQKAGGTIGGRVSFKYRWWELALTCGHTVERRMRYLPPTDGGPPSRGWAALHHGVSSDRVPPAPKQARCEWCARG